MLNWAIKYVADLFTSEASLIYLLYIYLYLLFDASFWEYMFCLIIGRTNALENGKIELDKHTKVLYYQVQPWGMFWHVLSSSVHSLKIFIIFPTKPEKKWHRSKVWKFLLIFVFQERRQEKKQNKKAFTKEKLRQDKETVNLNQNLKGMKINW